MYTNDQITAILQYSDISMFLGADEYEIEKYYNWIDETDRLEFIYVLKDVLSYYQPYYNSLNTAISAYVPGYSGNGTYDRMVNFLYSYIGRWIQDAKIISGNPNGVVVGQPTASIITNIVYAVNITNKSYTATGGETFITYTDMIFKNCAYVSRGGITMNKIITSGTPATDEVLWNTQTGTLTFSGSLSAGEVVVSLFN